MQIKTGYYIEYETKQDYFKMYSGESKRAFVDTYTLIKLLQKPNYKIMQATFGTYDDETEIIKV